MRNLDVSIIIPVFNAEKYLAECIDSVLNQSMPARQIILVDDGSTDGSGEICDRYGANFDFITVVHQPNAGVCAARNKGLSLVNCAYFGFLDSDDYLPSKAIEILFQDITANDADIACGLMDNDPNCGKDNLTMGNFELWQDKVALEKCLLDNPFTYSSCARLFRTDKFKDARFVDGRRIHEDSFFNFCCACQHPKVVVRNAPVYHYRYNPESASHAVFSEKFFDIIFFAEEKARIITEEYPEFDRLVNNMTIKANLALLQCLCNAKGNAYCDVQKKSIQTVIRLKDFFEPSTAVDKRLFWIVTNHLYWAFKLYYRVRYT